MTVCARCAQIALLPFPDDESLPSLDHSPSILVLLQSAKTCPLCQYFLSLFPEEMVSDFEGYAKQGIRTKTVVRAVATKRKLESENRIIKREYVLVSTFRDVSSSERFIMGSSAGWSPAQLELLVSSLMLPAPR
jgi:hypothetical protein